MDRHASKNDTTVPNQTINTFGPTSNNRYQKLGATNPSSAYDDIFGSAGDGRTSDEFDRDQRLAKIGVRKESGDAPGTRSQLAGVPQAPSASNARDSESRFPMASAYRPAQPSANRDEDGFYQREVIPTEDLKAFVEQAERQEGVGAKPFTRRRSSLKPNGQPETVGLSNLAMKALSGATYSVGGVSPPVLDPARAIDALKVNLPSENTGTPAGTLDHVGVVGAKYPDQNVFHGEKDSSAQRTTGAGATGADAISEANLTNQHNQAAESGNQWLPNSVDQGLETFKNRLRRASMGSNDDHSASADPATSRDASAKLNEAAQRPGFSWENAGSSATLSDGTPTKSVESSSLPGMSFMPSFSKVKDVLTGHRSTPAMPDAQDMKNAASNSMSSATTSMGQAKDAMMNKAHDAYEAVPSMDDAKSAVSAKAHDMANTMMPSNRDESWVHVPQSSRSGVRSASQAMTDAKDAAAHQTEAAKNQAEAAYRSMPSMEEAKHKMSAKANDAYQAMPSMERAKDTVAAKADEAYNAMPSMERAKDTIVHKANDVYQAMPSLEDAKRTAKHTYETMPSMDEARDAMAAKANDAYKAMPAAVQDGVATSAQAMRHASEEVSSTANAAADQIHRVMPGVAQARPKGMDSSLEKTPSSMYESTKQTMRRTSEDMSAKAHDAADHLRDAMPDKAAAKPKGGFFGFGSSSSSTAADAKDSMDRTMDQASSAARGMAKTMGDKANSAADQLRDAMPDTAAAKPKESKGFFGFGSGSPSTTTAADAKDTMDRAVDQAGSAANGMADTVHSKLANPFRARADVPGAATASSIASSLPSMSDVAAEIKDRVAAQLSSSNVPAADATAPMARAADAAGMPSMDAMKAKMPTMSTSHEEEGLLARMRHAVAGVVSSRAHEPHHGVQAAPQEPHFAAALAAATTSALPSTTNTVPQTGSSGLTSRLQSAMHAGATSLPTPDRPLHAPQDRVASLASAPATIDRESTRSPVLSKWLRPAVAMDDFNALGTETTSAPMLRPGPLSATGPKGAMARAAERETDHALSVSR